MQVFILVYRLRLLGFGFDTGIGADVWCGGFVAGIVSSLLRNEHLLMGLMVILGLLFFVVLSVVCLGLPV